MPQSLYELYYHLVWSTRDRIPYLNAHLQKVARDLIATKVTSLGCRLFAISCVEDHAHVVLWVPAQHSLAGVAGQIKGYSSHELRARHCVEFLWQEGYGAFTFRKSDLFELQDYVINQEAHHRHTW